MRLASPIALLKDMSLAAGSILARTRIGIGIYLKVEVAGKENLPPTPFVLCSNHTSHLDYVALVEALGIPYDKIIAVAAVDYHFDNSIRGYIFRRLFNLAPIERGRSLVALRRCASICQKFIEDGGKVVLVYPEGTRTADGEMSRFKHGFVPIVASLGLPVVPAYIEGGFEVFSRHHILPRPGRISVRFGRMIEFADPVAGGTGPKLSSAQVRQFAMRIEQAVRELSGNAGV